MFDDIIQLKKRKLKATWTLEVAKEYEKLCRKKVTDMYGVEIKPGYMVLIHCTEEKPKKAKVVNIFLDNSTINEPGYWVDIDDGSGVQGVMSYIIEVIGENNNV